MKDIEPLKKIGEYSLGDILEQESRDEAKFLVKQYLENYCRQCYKEIDKMSVSKLYTFLEKKDF